MQKLFDRTQIWKATIIALVLVPFVAASFWMIYQNLTQGSTDLYPRWIGAKMFWEDGISPYDPAVAEESQRMIYGRLAEPGEDKVLFAYPFYTIFHVGPLVLVEYKLAAAIYMETLLLGLVLALPLILTILRWMPSPMTLAIIVLWTITGYFSVRGILLGQPALAAYFYHIIVLWGIYKNRDTVSGMALGFSTIKPQTGYLIVPLLLIWAWRSKRYRVVGGFAATFGLMCGFSFLLEPSWLQDWLSQVRDYQTYTETVPVAHIMTHFIDGIPDEVTAAAQILLSLGILAPVARYWKNNFQGNPQCFLWGYFLTMAASVMIAPRMATTFYLELYPVLYITAYFMEKKRQHTMLLVGGIATLIGYWILHILTVPPVEEGGAGLEAPIVYVVFPVMILGLLWYYRAAWSQLENPGDLLAQSG